jgi:hypothetical protein
MDAKQLCGTLFAILFSPAMLAQTFPTTLGATITLPPMGAKAIPATLEASGALHLVNALGVRFHIETCWRERTPKNPILNGMDSMALGMLSLYWHH